MIHSGCIVMQFSCSVFVIIESVKKWALGCKNLRCQWWGDCPCSCVYFTIIVCEFALKLGDFRFAKCWQLAHKLIVWSKVTSHHVAYGGYYVKKTVILTSQVLARRHCCYAPNEIIGIPTASYLMTCKHWSCNLSIAPIHFAWRWNTPLCISLSACEKKCTWNGPGSTALC
jgi:hypothetical protein